MFSIWFFFSQGIHNSPDNREIWKQFLIPLYQFHPVHKPSASHRTQTRNLWLEVNSNIDPRLLLCIVLHISQYQFDRSWTVLQNLCNQYSSRKPQEKNNFNVCLHLAVTFFFLLFKAWRQNAILALGHIEVEFTSTDKFCWPLFIFHLK